MPGGRNASGKKRTRWQGIARLSARTASGNFASGCARGGTAEWTESHLKSGVEPAFSRTAWSNSARERCGVGPRVKSTGLVRKATAGDVERKEALDFFDGQTKPEHEKPAKSEAGMGNSGGAAGHGKCEGSKRRLEGRRRQWGNWGERGTEHGAWEGKEGTRVMGEVVRGAGEGGNGLRRTSQEQERRGTGRLRG
ncbi:hypothetical protein ERJ75_000625700 [Trypanosoma vivax]|nr:hypothetical protein ERJ75_000625700 [Trypanosoma vivax]